VELYELSGLIIDLLNYNSDYISQRLPSINVKISEQLEFTVTNIKEDLNKLSIEIMENGNSPDYRGELVFIEVVQRFAKIAESALQISYSAGKLKL
jgi:hypothetical protein